MSEKTRIKLERAENTALWDAVERTDPKHCKPITGKSYQGTSPKPHYLIHKATETFGPCGIGWGFTIADERIEEGAGGDRMHIAHVKVWYKWNGERGEVEHVGGTQFSGMRASGKPFTDEDAPKKSITDALVKALSMIGFAGDIFMGRYDDSKYVAEVRNEFAATPATPNTVTGPAIVRTSSAQLKRDGVWKEMMGEIAECETVISLMKLRTEWSRKALTDRWPVAWCESAGEEFDKTQAILEAQTVPDDDTFTGDRTPTYVDSMRAG